VTISARQKLLESVINMLWEMYGVKAQATDVYIFDDEAHLCTAKTADIFHASYHRFSNVYVPHLLLAGVHRIIAGRNKYYNINESLNILTESLKRGLSVADICNDRSDTIRKINKRKQKKKRRN